MVVLFGFKIFDFGIFFYFVFPPSQVVGKQMATFIANFYQFLPISETYILHLKSSESPLFA
jgi:hypothetical protein